MGQNLKNTIERSTRECFITPPVRFSTGTVRGHLCVRLPKNWILAYFWNFLTRLLAFEHSNMGVYTENAHNTSSFENSENKESPASEGAYGSLPPATAHAPIWSHLLAGYPTYTHSLP